MLRLRKTQESSCIYSCKPLRIAIPVLLAIAISVDLAATVYGALLVEQQYVSYYGAYWCAPSAIMCIVSIIDASLRGLRRLQPRYAIFTSLLGVVAWITAAGLYSGSKWINVFNDARMEFDSWYGSHMAFYMRFFAIPGTVFYFLYLACTIVAWRADRQRSARYSSQIKEIEFEPFTHACDNCGHASIGPPRPYYPELESPVRPRSWPNPEPITPVAAHFIAEDAAGLDRKNSKNTARATIMTTASAASPPTYREYEPSLMSDAGRSRPSEDTLTRSQCGSLIGAARAHAQRKPLPEKV